MAPQILKESVKLTKIRKTSATTPSIVTLDLYWTTDTDVDLGVLLELRDGPRRKYVIQALDREFGSLTSAPYISLSGDDRHGGHEQIQLDLAHMDNVVRAMAFAYIYQGGNWRTVGDARVEVHHPTLGDFVIPLDKSRAHSCALVDFQSDGNGGLVMTRLAEFFRGYQADIDRHYGWPNINWQAGSKD